MTMNVAEIVTFELAPSTTEEAFVEIMKQTETFVRGCAGFIDRRLSRGADGRWSDRVIWQDMESAQAAAKAFEQQPFLPAVIGAMKPDSVQMRHETIWWAMAAA